MGEALLAGLIDAGWEPDTVAVAEVDPERRRVLEERFPAVRVVPSAAWAVADADVVVVAVKPHDVAETLASTEEALPADALVVSLAAGVPIFVLEAAAPQRAVVRAMPNTAALVGRGAAAIAAGRHATDAHLDTAEQILTAVGTVVRLPEEHLDAVTALSGSGPAYLFLVAEALVEAGVLVGLTRDVADGLVRQTLLGAATLLERSDEQPDALRAAVTSPAGTTAAAVRVLEARGVRAAFLDAVAAAAARSREPRRRGPRSVTRRPRGERPRHLPDRSPPHPTVRRSPKPPSPARRLVAGGAAGPHPTLGREETWAAARHLAAAPRPAGAAPVTPAEVRDALEAVAGPQDGPRVRIDPDRALDAARRAGAAVARVARAGGTVAFATGAPASLLPWHVAMARAAAAAGATVPAGDAAGPYLPGRSLWWHDRVAVATDGRTLLDERRPEAGDEWLFTVGRPDLAVADGIFARQAIAAGLPTVTVADLDAPDAALAAHRGGSVVVVPAAARRPPAAYQPLVDALLEALAVGPAAPSAGDGSRQPPHLATETPGPYAAPHSGGEEG